MRHQHVLIFNVLLFKGVSPFSNSKSYCVNYNLEPNLVQTHRRSLESI